MLFASAMLLRCSSRITTQYSPTLSLDLIVFDFYFRLNDQLRSTVAAVVHEELLKDVQAQHYTQRMQKATLAKSTQPLAKKIEEKVEEKLAELKKELEELRAVKLASPPKPVEPVVEEEDEDGEMEGGEFEEHAGNPDSWCVQSLFTFRTSSDALLSVL